MQPDSVKNMSALIKKNITQKSKETYPLRDFKRFSLFLSSLVRGARAKSSSSTSSATPTPYELLTESPLEDDLNYVSLL